MSPTPNSGLGFLRRLRLRDVVIFSLPPFLAALYLLLASAGDYRRMRQFDDWWSSGARIDHFAWWRVRAALHLPQAMALDERLTAEDTQRALVDLRVARDDFARIADDPVGHAGESVKAWLAEGDTLQEVDLKLRGDTSVHWTGEKKTLSIKSARGEAFHGALVNVFSCKEVLEQYAANSMAQDFDLVAPPTAVVPVFLNKRFFGMFRNFSPLDESFAHRTGRIPGNIFRGDTAERGDYFKGLPRELFVNPYIWDRIAEVQEAGSTGMERLFEFVARVNCAGANELLAGRMEAWSLVDLLNQRVAPADADSISKLFEIVDQGEIARLFALDLCVGDPWHTSGVHNHFWYEDRSSGVLHPIPWDLRMLDLEHPPPGANFNRFWRAALRDPRVFAAALNEIHERNKDGKLFQATSERVLSTWERYRDGFEFDRLRCGPPGTAPNPDVGSPEDVLGTLKKNLATLESWCGDARASVAVTQVSDTRSIIDVLVDGRAPVEMWALELDAKSEPVLTADTYPDGERFLADRQLPLQAEGPLLRLVRPEPLLPGVRPLARLEREAIHYRFFLESRGGAATASAIKLRNAITKEPVRAALLQQGSLIPASTSIHPWRLGERTARKVGMGLGADHLSKTVEVPRGSTLTIAPGTQLVLDPEVSILCKGMILALGTEASPITIGSSDPLRPFGSIVLLGEGASGSRFEHVKFSGGGGTFADGVEFTGMVCVHGARNVKFDDCEFSGNQRCDDALHAAQADLALNRCQFHDTNATALSLDSTSALIDHCKIERAGKHGIRARTSSPRILGNEIQDCKGSGISIGGESSALVFGNTIGGSQCGIEARDRATPLILNNTLAKNRTAVLARLESPHCDRGGWPRVVRTILTDNAADFTVDKHSALTTLESRTGTDDGSTVATADENVAWIRASTGLFLEPDSTGAPASWSTAVEANAIAEERFSTGWIAPEATWRKSGSATSLRSFGDALVVRMNAGRGRIARDVAWDLSDATRKNWLVLEASSTGIKSAGVRVVRDGARPGDETASAALELPGGSEARFAYTIVELPAGKYSSLTLDFEPYDASGRICLGSWRVISAAAQKLKTSK